MENTFEQEEIEMQEAIAEETEITDAETISFEEEDVPGDEVEENPDEEDATEEEIISEEEEEQTTESTEEE